MAKWQIGTTVSLNSAQVSLNITDMTAVNPTFDS